MHHPTDRITHTTAFVTTVVEHWLEREIQILKKEEGICTVVHELINSKLHDSSFQPFVPSSESIISYDSDDSMLSEDSEREDTEDEEDDDGDRPKTL